ncbi:hypothetical protein HJC23_008846 [Cyclotella cryptica]|uniref:Uncharacterized protein n=1 Tax=Cyclotella cryptica TaxID=29204 RepID=A0ABD3Q990_9STRA
MVETKQVNRKLKAHGVKRENEHHIMYNDTSFCSRPSSGRPGSPHRYFNDSYIVTFKSERSRSIEGRPYVDNRNASLNSKVHKAVMDEAKPRISGTCYTKEIHGTESANQEEAGGLQVVHRHLNGLCIITAGDTLKKIISASAKSNACDGVSVASVKYYVTVAQGAQSARGKLRARTRKLHSDEASNKPTILSALAHPDELNHQPDVIQHDGTVKPHDTLCTISFTNGMEIQLKCCVGGTVIDLNHRLSQPTAHDTNNATKSSELKNDIKVFHSDYHDIELGNKVDAPGNGQNLVLPGHLDPSLLLSDPLLDGYLAVILPSGVFPPKKSRRNLDAV